MENLDQKIKLPSNWALVNPDSIWGFIVSISKSGNVFTKEQLIKAGLSTSNEDNIKRNLSYLKYLGIIEEERGKGKDQRFKVVDQSQIRAMLYELKANRADQAKQKFKEHLQNHSLFQILKQNFFKNEQNKTLTELEHFLKDLMPGKAPQYYQKGGEFLIKLLNFVSLSNISGNDISLDGEINKKSKDSDEKRDDNLDIESILPTREEKNALPKASGHTYEEVHLIVPDKYVVQFIGPGINTKLEIQEEDDLIIVEATLAKIKKKIKINETH